MQYDVSIIVVNYNGRRYLDNLFESLYNMDTGQITYEIVFVDNNSSDDSVYHVRKNYCNKFKGIKIIESDKNLGFAGGNNLGVSSSDGEYLAFLNNDTAVDRFWLKELYNCIVQTKAAIVNSKQIFFYDFIKVELLSDKKPVLNRNIEINGEEYCIEERFAKNVICKRDTIVCKKNAYLYLPLNNGIDNYVYVLYFSQDTDNRAVFCYINGTKYNVDDNGRCYINLTKDELANNKTALIQNVGSDINKYYYAYDIGLYEEDKGQYEEVRELNSACAAAMIMKKDDFQAVEGFDEKFFMYYEDADLSFKVKNMGKKLIYCPMAVIRHVHTGSSVLGSVFFTYYSYRNNLLFVKRYMGLKGYSVALIRQFAGISKLVLLRRISIENLIVRFKAIKDSFLNYN